MTINIFLDKLNSIDYGILSLSIFVVGIFLLIFYFIRKSGYFGISQIVDIKRQKEYVVNELIDTLAKIDTFNNKLLKQKEIIESYDTDTVVSELQLVQDVIDSTSKYICLNNDILLKKIIFYFSGQQKMLNELKNIEQESYQFQVEYQQRVVYYNREFDKLKEQNIDEDTLIQYKKEILNELEKIRINVSTALTNLKLKRDDFSKELSYSQELAKDLLNDLTSYKNREIKSKRFYLRYLAFL